MFLNAVASDASINDPVSMRNTGPVAAAEPAQITPTIRLPLWRAVASTGNLVPTLPPIFTRDDLIYTPPVQDIFNWEVRDRGDGTCDLWSMRQTSDGPQGTFEGNVPCAEARARTSTKGAWHLNLYGVPFANVPYFGDDPNSLYVLGQGSTPPTEFVFGIKSGPDQGYFYKYQFDAQSGKFFPVGTTGLIGGRGNPFDTNAFIRNSNKMLAITVIAMVGGYFLAGAGVAGAGAEAGAGGATTAESVAAADIAGGLVPEYGAIPAYEAGIAAPSVGAVLPGGLETGAIPVGDTDLFAGGISSGSGAGIPGGEGLTSSIAQSVIETGTVTQGAWDALLEKAKDAAGNYAKSQLVRAIQQQITPTKPPARAVGVAGTITLPDGSHARVNPDGSISIIDSHGATETVNADGSVSKQWISGVPNTAVVIGSVLALLLLTR